MAIPAIPAVLLLKGPPRTGSTREPWPARTRRSRWSRTRFTWTTGAVSAGVSAGIDLALALVERDHGAGLARDVARSLVVFLQRPGGQSQFWPSLRTALPRTSPLRQLCDTIVASPAGDYSLARLAAMASLSPRHLTRLFREELGTTPARYVELIRFDTAKDLLDAGHSVTDTALRSGYGSTETLRHAFIQHLGVSPRAYQQRFRSAIRN